MRKYSEPIQQNYKMMREDKLQKKSFEVIKENVPKRIRSKKVRYFFHT